MASSSMATVRKYLHNSLTWVSKNARYNYKLLKIMAVDIKETKNIIDILKKMSSAELAVTIFLMFAAVYGAFWIEGRYVKIKQLKEEIERTEASIKVTEQDIKKHKTEILLMNARTLEILKQYPEPVQDTIERNSKKFVENYLRLENSK